MLLALDPVTEPYSAAREEGCGLKSMPDPRARLPLPARTRHTVTDRTALERQLQATRERGYSLDIQENEDDICCYGRAIVGRDGRPLGCISVSMPRYRFEETDARPITQAMAECVRDIARECDG